MSIEGVVAPMVMLPLYGTGVSRYAGYCRMILNKWNGAIREQIRLVALARLRCAVFTLALALALASPCAGQVEAAGGQSANDQDKSTPGLVRQIRHQIRELPFYSQFDFITFTLDGRKVTLSGQVLRPSLKKHAEAAIKSLVGVDTVSNEIEVLPSAATDNELRRAVYRAIYEDPVLAGYAVEALPAIHIIVKNGSVTLEGTVNSSADKSLAARRAGTAANVTAVKNNLKIQSSQNAPE